MHRVAPKRGAIFAGTVAPCRRRPVVALPKIETMIDMSVEITRTVIPRSGPDEYTAGEPLRAIIAIRSAVVRRNLIVSVRTNRRYSNADRNLRGSFIGGRYERTHHDTQQS